MRQRPYRLWLAVKQVSLSQRNPDALLYCADALDNDVVFVRWRAVHAEFADTDERLYAVNHDGLVRDRWMGNNVGPDRRNGIPLSVRGNERN